MLIITNIIINYFLLKITLLLSRTIGQTKRMVLSSVIGSIFSFMIFADTNFAVSLIVKIIAVILSVLLAFGYGNKTLFIRLNFYCFAAHMIFAGLMTLLLQSSQVVYINNLYFYVNLNPFVLIGAILAVYIILSVFELLNVNNKEYNFTIYITLGGCTFSAQAYYDTGFNLKDVLTHHPVMLCSADFLADKTDAETVRNLNNFFETKQYESKNIIPVFYSDVSQSSMMPAIRPDKVIIKRNKKETEIKSTILAVTQQGMPQDIQIIFGKEIYNMIGD